METPRESKLLPQLANARARQATEESSIASRLKWGNLSLVSKLMLSTSLVLLAATAVLITSIVRTDIEATQARINRAASDEIGFLIPGLTDLAIIGDYAALRQLVRAKVEHRSIESIRWEDARGNVIEEMLESEDCRAPAWFKDMVGIVPAEESRRIVIGNYDYGVVAVKISAVSAINNVWDRLLKGVQVAFAALVIVLAVIAIIVTNALRPLNILENAVQRFGAGDYAIRLRPFGGPSMRSTMAAFNRMADQIGHFLNSHRKLGAHLEAAREEQNRIIARELHDSLGGNLSMLNLSLGSMLEDLDEDDPARERLQRMLALCDNTIRLSRNITSALRPAMLDTLGLFPTIRWYASEFTKMTGIECAFDLCSDASAPKENAAALFRIVQESLTNVAKHSGATRVAIRACSTNEDISIEIVDNGRGAPILCSGVNGSFGIFGMRERMQSLGGTFEAISLPGRGTTVSVTLPHRPT